MFLKRQSGERGKEELVVQVECKQRVTCGHRMSPQPRVGPTDGKKVANSVSVGMGALAWTV